MSKQLDCDIAIVGAGPAGLIAAASLAMMVRQRWARPRASVGNEQLWSHWV